MIDKHTCEARTGMWSVHHRSRPACGKNAKYEEDGHWYCGIHRPSAVKARKEKSEAHYRAYCVKADAISRVSTAQNGLVDAVRKCKAPLPASVKRALNALIRAKAALAKLEEGK